MIRDPEPPLSDPDWRASLFPHRGIQNKENSSLKGQSRFVLEAVAFFCPPKRRIVSYVTACCKWPMGTQGICVTLDFIKKKKQFELHVKTAIKKGVIFVWSIQYDAWSASCWYRDSWFWLKMFVKLKGKINYIIKNQHTRKLNRPKTYPVPCIWRTTSKKKNLQY